MTLRQVKAAKSLTDEQLVDICKKELYIDQCEVQSGPSATLTKIDPPTNTLAVIININARGSVKVYKESDKEFGIEFIGKVSPEDCENGNNLVIVSWDASWWYRALGDTKIRYVVKT